MKGEVFLEMLGDVREDFILEAEKPAGRGMRRFPAKVLLAAALLAMAVGAAVASYQSHLLDHIFRNSEQPPTPAAQAHLVQVEGEAEASADISFRVDEYLLDDDRLYLSWTVENHTGKPLIFRGPFVEGDGEYELRAGSELNAAGGEVLGQALPEAYSETSEYRVSGAGEGPVKVTLVALEPIAAFVDSRTSSPTGKPVIVWNADFRRPESFCFGYHVGPALTRGDDGQFVEDDGSDGWGPWMSASYNYDDWEALLDDGFGNLMDLGAWAEAAEQLGYARLAKRFDVEVTLENGAARRNPARELPRFECEDYTVVITEFSQTDLTNRLRFQVVPKREGIFDDGWPEFRVKVNGAAEEPRSLKGWGYILGDSWFREVEPVDDAPRILAEEREWLNDGEPVREIRLETEGGEGIDWRL